VQGTPVLGVSKTLRRRVRNGITELSQRAPPIFSRAAITLGIGPHSTYGHLCNMASHYTFTLWFLFVLSFFLLWPPYVIGQVILYFHPVVSSFFLAESQRSEIGCLPYFHTWCGPSVNLQCRSQTCCARLAENTARKKSPKSRHLGTIPQLCRAISSQLRHVSTIGKKNC